jgi:phosphoribosylamine---glycine ligase
VKVLLVGSGGREHALAWKLARSSSLVELHCAPGNPGIARHARCHPVRADDAEGLLALALELSVDLAVIGPEAPLVAGVADALRRSGVPTFGPSAAAAAIEGSKTFAKEVMHAAGVPTPATMPVAEVPCVIKADGLAGGKGVFVCSTREELDAALPAADSLGQPLVVEELLEGREVSVFALCDGARVIPLPPAQDFKRAFDDDEGPNTGGMGSYAPAPEVDVHELVDAVHRPVLEELARRGSPFVGVLFAGLMLTERGPQVLEFNCRFGDPETQSLVPLVDDGLLEALAACAAGDARRVDLHASDDAAVTVVIAAGSYPAAGDAGSPIAGIDEAEATGALVFHAGTALHEDALVTNGGRILGVTATGPTLGAARDRAYEAASFISFAGARYRTDVARQAAAVV